MQESLFDATTTVSAMALSNPEAAAASRATPSTKTKVLCCSVDNAFVDRLLPCFDVCRVDNSEQALSVLSAHPEDHFASVIVRDDNDHWKEGKAILQTLYRRKLLPLRLVWSETCSRIQTNGDTDSDSNNRGESHDPEKALLFAAGADAVVGSVQAVVDAQRIFQKSIPDPEGSLSGVLDRRSKRQAILRDLAGGYLTLRLNNMHSHSNRFRQQLEEAAKEHRPVEGSEESIRIVHISDTHNFHRYVDLPDGDLLLHTGDICGNYRTPYEFDVIDQFRDFLAWLEEKAIPKFDKIMFIGGNHDTYLDRMKYPDIQKQVEDDILLPFLEKNPKVEYLCHSGTTYRGLCVYGTPTTICRVEAYNNRMRSNAFERTIDLRFKAWEQIPDDVDILLTHLPPSGMALGPSGVSCSMLTSKVYLESPTKRPPRLHAFGHVHSSFGLAVRNETVLSNASQERLLRCDLHGGATPLVIDLPLL